MCKILFDLSFTIWKNIYFQLLKQIYFCYMILFFFYNILKIEMYAVNINFYFDLNLECN